MSLSSNDQTKAKKTAAVFVALAVIIVAAMVAAMVIIPYDPGTLAPATLSSNLCYGGNVTETDDYVFFRQRNGNLGRLSRENGEIKTVFEGDVSCLNPLDGFIYFIDGGDIKKTTYYGTVSESIASTATTLKRFPTDALRISQPTTALWFIPIKTDCTKWPPTAPKRPPLWIKKSTVFATLWTIYTILSTERF